MNIFDHSTILLVGSSLLLIITLFSLLIFIFIKFRTHLKILKGILQEISRSIHTDPVTGLPNRPLFHEQFKEKIEKAKQKQQKVALLFLDIDHFRHLRDSHGYAMVDSLLEIFAKRLMLAMNDHIESLSRLESDHFTIIIENFSQEKELTKTVTNILGLIAEPFCLNNQEISITTAIGITVYPDDGADVESLLKNAGIARYYAKKLGNNSYSFYTKEMQAQVSWQRNIEVQLRQAIAKNELSVYYQPKINVQTGKIIGSEALLRWDNKEFGKVSPAQFIPIAEQTGLIIEIGDWILREACIQTKKWHTDGFKTLTVAVNLSANQFKDDYIVEHIAKVLWDSGLETTSLELELTESAIMENVEKSLLILRALKTMGIQISVDDFGTGHSSLSQLKIFPFDSLKIDQSFIKNILHPKKELDDRIMISTIITMAKQLGLKVIAEGVETEQQFSFLKEEGCDIIQGYLFSKPISADDFSNLLVKNKNT